MLRLIPIIAFLLGAHAAEAKVIHVAAGSGAGNGSAARPFSTIGQALMSPYAAGDTILVHPGTYPERLFIWKGGQAGRHVILRSMRGSGARIRPPHGTYSTVNIRANYVTVQGFDIVGGSGHGIDGERVHHVHVLGNTVHDSGGSGISFYLSEFQLIEGNRTFRNAATNGYQTSGISVASNIDLTGDRRDRGFRTVIRRNISHDNVIRSVPGPHTDGNGIIIDWLRNLGTGYAPYAHPALIEDNLVFRNGGKGIQVFQSDDVTVRNNTAWHNNLDPLNPGTERGEITITESAAGAVVQNNIAVADPGANADNTAFSLAHPSVRASNNLGYGGSAPVILWNGAAFDAEDGNISGVDPMFVQPGQARFALRPGSVAIDAGTGGRPAGTRDLAGNRRVVGVIDMGAFEQDAGLTRP